MLIKYNKKLGGWEIKRITDEEKEMLMKVGIEIIIETCSKVFTEEKLQEHIENEEKESKKSVKH